MSTDQKPPVVDSKELIKWYNEGKYEEICKVIHVVQ